jgi:hypothetical protein
MARIHSVQQGEHLSSIAAAYGFWTIAPIWDHPQNADLRSRRGDGNILLPGDEILIPAKEEGSTSRPTGARHRFRVTADKLHLRLTLLDVQGAPMADTKCQVTVEGMVSDLATDADGHIDLEIPRHAKSGTLALDGLRIPIHIGDLDPVDETTGAVARLVNLGYYRAPVEPVDEAELRCAIEEFQCDYGLEVTGECDTDTLATLQVEHGC